MTAQPNILFVFPDQLRWDWVEPIADVPVRTPNVKKLAERGANFSHAWTPSPICAPARACLATGRNYDRSPVQHNKHNVPPNSDTVYRRLSRAGYEVSSVGKLDLLKGFMDWGADGQHWVHGESRLFDLGFTRGIDSAGKHDAIYACMKGVREPYMDYLASRGLDSAHMEDFLRRDQANLKETIGVSMNTSLPPPPAYGNLDYTPLPADAYGDNWIGQNGADELERLIEIGKPWCMTVNFSGPHEPLDVTPEMRAGFADVTFPMPVGYEGDDEETHQTMRRNYAAIIELVDGWLGSYVSILEAAGQLDNTLIVFSSDHGEMLGDTGLWAKSVHFEPSLRVPLIIAGPGCRKADAPLRYPVSLLDMAATFLDMAGCSTDGMEGISLRPTLEKGAAHGRQYVFSGLGNWRAVSDGRYKLVIGFRDVITNQQIQFARLDDDALATAKLYDLDNDTKERNDISARQPEIYQRLLEVMAADIADAVRLE